MNLASFIQRAQHLEAFDLGGRRFNGYAPLVDRLAAGVCVCGLAECWPWRHAVGDKGYGRIQVDNQPRLPHRLLYELLVGPIPKGYTIDHTCHNGDASCPGGVSCLHRRCMNPVHFEAVSPRTNVLRGKGTAAVRARATHCPQGHPYDEANTRLSKRNERSCRACSVAGVRALRERRLHDFVRDSPL